MFNIIGFGKKNGAQEKTEKSERRPPQKVLDSLNGAKVYDDSGNENKEVETSDEMISMDTVEEPDSFEDLRKSDHKKIYIMLVMDATYSFTEIFPEVYKKVGKMLNEIKKTNQIFAAIQVSFGLVTFGSQMKVWKFAGGNSFTENTEKLLAALRDTEFTGGNSNGREDIDSAVQKALYVLESETEQYANRGIFVLSDALPIEKEDGSTGDFMCIDGINHNWGLRFAKVFAYNSEYPATFKIVDGDGNETDTKNVYAEITGIDHLLDESEGIRMEDIVGEIMKKSSVIQ